MGLERIAAVLQGVHDNYDTDDLFKALIAAIGRSGTATTDRANQASHRVIADHLRASGFLIADGVLPVERRPRLCPAPHHAPRHAPRAPAGHHRAADAPAWCRRWSVKWVPPIPNWCAPSR
jgi:hypothetical protein